VQRLWALCRRLRFDAGHDLLSVARGVIAQRARDSMNDEVRGVLKFFEKYAEMVNDHIGNAERRLRIVSS
jgi:ubiquinone biosynthesis protein UbiJ